MSAPTRADLKAAREGMRGVRETRQAPIAEFEIREIPNGTGGVNLRFTGYASTTCANDDDMSNAYELEDMVGPWTEQMIRGCFARTIRDGCDTTLLVNHEGVSMARTKAGTLKLAEDDTGLYTEALLNPSRPDVQVLRAAIEDGAIDEMSFAFWPIRQEWSEDWTRRWIREVSLNKGDVSAVNYGANDHTGGLVAIRKRLFGTGVSERPAAARSRSTTPVILPDYTPRARLDLAQARGRGASGTRGSLTEARSLLEAAKRNGESATLAVERARRSRPTGIGPEALAEARRRAAMTRRNY